MNSVWFAVVIALPVLAIVLWTAGAIYYDMVGASTAARLAAFAWVAACLAAFILWHPLWKPLVALLVIFACVVVWWLSLRPSLNRDWNPHFTCLPRMTLDGDSLTVENIRNSQYAGVGQSTAHFETRHYRLSELCGIDVLILNWGMRWMSHPMFVFDFGPDGRICISIEVRYRVGQKFSFFRTLYRQQEQMYVVSDERDAILRRTKFMSNHNMHLYRLYADDIALRQFFLEYAISINELAKTPRWYHGLTKNCTTSAYAHGRRHIRWNWRMLLNGTFDRLLYERKFMDQSQPFEKLKELSWVNDIANRAPEVGFGDYLRANLPGYRAAQKFSPITAERAEA